MGRNADRNHARNPAVLPVAFGNPISPAIRARAVIDPDGICWRSMRQAGNAYSLSAEAIRYRCVTRRGGWRFAKPSDPEPAQ